MFSGKLLQRGLRDCKGVRGLGRLKARAQVNVLARTVDLVWNDRAEDGQPFALVTDEPVRRFR
jgi:hypothetical protein